MSDKPAHDLHTSVLLAETIDFVGAKRGGMFVDATLGLGGHTEAILLASEKASVLGLDQDVSAIDLASKRLEAFGNRVQIVHSNFASLEQVLSETGIGKVDGIIADLGVSSLQLDSEERGFSFRFDAPLDMRMDQTSDEPTAAELLATLPEVEIADIIYRYGEERFSRRIARWIVEKREAGTPVTTTNELVALIERSVRRSPKDKIHPATRTFQALRIAVNRETEILEQFLLDAIENLKPDGRLVIISFHSLEDRIVKHVFQKMSGKCSCPPRLPLCMCGAVEKVEVLTRKPVPAGDEETAANPRARSAKLRAVKRIETEVN
ncbi:MAG TPA: 16S rRNA (cytosine(1402)-N(4))-methyltransferase RsmH [Pyrinomonadaceae bacterium]|nr:16S rRNA (cytosine(1402)-N(4))-methyltransferase RsmH [Pyrinomonadaceae bacterium]